jgi:hypothetical protein
MLEDVAKGQGPGKKLRPSHNQCGPEGMAIVREAGAERVEDFSETVRSRVGDPARPALVATAIAAKGSIAKGVARVYNVMNLVSRGPIFFPKYSGILPIISPARMRPTNAVSASWGRRLLPLPDSATHFS